jgi:hypothetical protein
MIIQVHVAFRSSQKRNEINFFKAHYGQNIKERILKDAREKYQGIFNC